MTPIFIITKHNDTALEKIYETAMEELQQFYELNWVRNRPKVCIVASRADFDVICGRKTEDWFVGFGANKLVYLLDKGKFETESSHKYTPKSYSQLLKHELSHLFYFSLTESNYPVWLTEGLAIYTSGQVDSWKQVESFKSFLNFFKVIGRPVYEEAGLAIKILVEEFGREKFIQFIKSMKGPISEEVFSDRFQDVFNLPLDYDNLNKLLIKHKKSPTDS